MDKVTITVFKGQKNVQKCKERETEAAEEALQAPDEEKIGNDKIVVYRERNKYSFDQQEIHYISAFNGYCELTIGELVFRKEISLTQLYSELDNSEFYCINRQHIVSMGHIKQYLNGGLHIGEKSFTVSRRKRKEFERRWTVYHVSAR